MDLFTEGQKLTLFFVKDNNMVEMVCNVDQVYEDRLDIAPPQYFMRYINQLQVGKSLTAKAFSKLGTVDFNTIIISSPLEETFTIEMDYNSLRLTPGSEIPVISAVEHLEIINSNNVLILKTFEISTDYIKFVCDKNLQLNDKFEGVLNLPKDYGIINFTAVVTDIDPIYENEYTAVYETMTEVARQSLLYYMYMYTKDNN